MHTGRLLMTLPAWADNWCRVTFTADGLRLVALDGKARMTIFDAPGFETPPVPSPAVAAGPRAAIDR